MDSCRPPSRVKTQELSDTSAGFRDARFVALISSYLDLCEGFKLIFRFVELLLVKSLRHLT